jgi:hypothetical protein
MTVKRPDGEATAPLLLLDRSSEGGRDSEDVSGHLLSTAGGRTTGFAAVPTGVRRFGFILLGLQLVALLVFSTVLYRRFTLTGDFADYSQAWWAIGHGHLDPFITGAGVSFWRINAEFIMYPLALLVPLYPHTVVLLWVQDLAVVATELVAFRWILDVIGRATEESTGPGEKDRQAKKDRQEKKGGRVISAPTASALGLGAAVVLVANPWVYETIAFDFHLEPIVALFCLLAGYDLWAGRTRRLWWWVALALLSSVLGGVYLVGVGLSGVLAGRRTRKTGAVVGAVGLGWAFVFSTIGAAGVNGEFVRSSFGYLVGPQKGRIGLVEIVVGALSHPGAVVHTASMHWAVVLSFLVVLGVIGVISPWGFPMAFVVFVPNILDGTGSFIRYGAAFQSWPAMSFILIGSFMVLVGLLQRGGVARRVAAITMALWAALLGAFAFVALPSLPKAWLWVTPPAAAELARIEPEIPAGAEVIVSLPVMGRFAQRDSIYGFIDDGERFPVNRRQVVFVFSPYESFQKKLSRHGITAATGYVARRLDARVLGARSGVDGFLWTPPAGTTSVTLP